MLEGKTALILGLTGGYGRVMAVALARRGVGLRALVRDRTRGEEQVAALGVPVELVVGDVLDPELLAKAARGTDIIVHGVNAPYDRWDPFVIQAAEAVAEAACTVGATIAFPGNVYAYAPGEGISETTAASPPTPKGELRLRVEAILTAATQRGARLVILRGGDFYGVGTQSTWLANLLSGAVKGGAIRYPTDLSVRHQWAFLPDFAEAHASLLGRTGLPPASRFHFAGNVLTGTELVDAVRTALGDPGRRVGSLPWPLLRMVSWVHPMTRELLAMRYLWDQEVLMDGDLLQNTLGTVPHTPLVQAVAAELEAMGA